jgi:hypothetical protein
LHSVENTFRNALKPVDFRWRNLALTFLVAEMLSKRDCVEKKVKGQAGPGFRRITNHEIVLIQVEVNRLWRVTVGSESRREAQLGACESGEQGGEPLMSIQQVAHGLSLRRLRDRYARKSIEAPQPVLRCSPYEEAADRNANP